MYLRYIYLNKTKIDTDYNYKNIQKEKVRN